MIANDIATRSTGNTPTVRRGRVAIIALWVTQIALAAMFLFAGGSKLAGAPAMVNLFAAIGWGQWFRYVTGAIEISAAIALMIPSAAPVRGDPARSDDVRCGDSQSVPWSVTGCAARAVARRCGSCMDPSQPAPGCVLSLKPRPPQDRRDRLPYDYRFISVATVLCVLTECLRLPSRSGCTLDSCEARCARWPRIPAEDGRRHDPRVPGPQGRARRLRRPEWRRATRRARRRSRRRGDR